MKKGVVFDIKELTVHDGPGVRVTVFFKGCPLRCVWCHNPEGLSPEPEIFQIENGCVHCGKCRAGCDHKECEPFGACTRVCPKNLVRISGKTYEAGELANELKTYRPILEKLHGGITISGGEPLTQADFLLELLENLKPLHTAVQTSGYGAEKQFHKVISTADLVMFDMKVMDPAAHLKYTGVDNSLILRNLEQLIGSGKDFIARIPLIPGVNDSAENFAAAAAAIKPAKSRVKVEIMPYNRLAGAKYQSVGLRFNPPFDEKGAPRYPLAAFEDNGIPYRIL